MRLTLKYAFRQLAKSPGFTFVSIVMLALGIAMSTSTFSVTNSALLRAMPFPQSDQLVRVFRTDPHSQMLAHSPGNFLDLKAATTSFSGIAAYHPEVVNLTEPGQPPEQVFGISVSADFLTTLGVQPFLGRGFATDQDQPGKGDVVLLTNSYWVRRFNSDPKVLGKTLRVGTANLTVIGVLPPSFDTTLIWFGSTYVRPLTIWPSFATMRKGKWFEIIGRLKPGISIRTAQPELTTIGTRLASDHPAENALDNFRVTDLGSSFVDSNSRKLYWLITGLAVSVLGIACANLASVQLARAFSRSHEFSVRSALGASRLALMGPLLVESTILSLGGWILGVVLAYWTNHLISHFFTGNFEIQMDGFVVGFACLAALLTGLTFGLAPSWLASRVSIGDALKESSRGSTSSRFQQRLKYLLIMGQLALALVLVSAALSFGVAVKQTLKRDLGWKTANLVSGVAVLPWAPPEQDPKKFEFIRNLHEKLSQIPGVTQVAIASEVPLYGYPGQNSIIVEGDAPVPTGQEPIVITSAVEAGYFSILNIPLKAGRYLPENIRAGDPSVVLINETMARRYWPEQSAIGKRVRFVGSQGWSEIIGVVGDVRMNASFDRPASQLQVYQALEQGPSGFYNFIVKSTLPPETFFKPVRQIVGDLNPDIMVQQIGGVDATLNQILAGNNFMIISLGSFAFIGLLIALIGLYGVISQLTIQRHREIGIRIALGADNLSVVRMILGQSGRLLIGGIIVGLAGSCAVSRLYQRTMPELQLPGLALQVSITLLLCLAGLLASYFPARRAGRIDPVVALRAE